MTIDFTLLWFNSMNFNRLFNYLSFIINNFHCSPDFPCDMSFFFQGIPVKVLKHSQLIFLVIILNLKTLQHFKFLHKQLNHIAFLFLKFHIHQLNCQMSQYIFRLHNLRNQGFVLFHRHFSSMRANANSKLFDVFAYLKSQ